MIPVKRNGIFQYTEYLEPNDIRVTEKPHEFAELDAVNNWQINIEKAKQAKIQKFKLEIAPGLVYFNAPEYKQVNSALGIYSDEKKTEIVNWIQAIRKLSAEIETEINSIVDIVKLDEFKFDIEILRSKAENMLGGFND